METLFRPKMMNIEITTRCSARCSFCPHDSLDRKNKDMPIDDVMKIIDEGYFIGIRDIHLHLFGEPTMHLDYVRILSLIKEKYPSIKLMNYTNGWGINQELIRKAMLEHLDRIVISVDGSTMENMLKTRPGLNPDLIVEGIKSLYNERKGNLPHISIRMIDMGIVNVENYKNFWSKYSDGISVAYLQDFHGFKNFDAKVRENKPCDRIFYHVAVTVNKDIVFCCDDYMGEIILGNLSNRNILDIWNGERMQELRKLHLECRLNEIDMCSKCTYKGYAKI